MGNLAKSWRLLATTATMVLVAGVAQAQSVPESKDPIKLALNEWTGQLASSYIYGSVLEKMGYTVEYVTAGAVPQYEAMVSGNLTANPENWDNNVGEIYPKAVASGDLVLLGPLGIDAVESWVYPAYMEAKCPGLPDWKALMNCGEAFATPETMPNGRVIDYPADWGARAEPLIAALGLPMTAIPGGSEGAMVAEIKSAVAAEEPVLVMFWAPHWLFSEVEMKWVDLPPYEEGCDEDPTKGPIPDKVGDCSRPAANVSKVAWKGMKDKWPAAWKVLEAMSLDNTTQQKLMFEVDNKGRDIKEVVQEWMDQNESVWQNWVSKATS
ncbi:MAG: ABC transporter substrate-binding protein [Rhodospirillaceae bacterium]|nr:ABC transporter substrate-binding protein [Rhodospirillaceae bacterium]